MFGLSTLTAVAKAVVLVVGGGITLLARRAARRTGSGALRLFAVGIGTITAGALAGDAVAHLGIGPRGGAVLRDLLVAVGFAVLGYSLYAGRDAPPPADGA